MKKPALFLTILLDADSVVNDRNQISGLERISTKLEQLIPHFTKISPSEVTPLITKCITYFITRYIKRRVPELEYLLAGDIRSAMNYAQTFGAPVKVLEDLILSSDDIEYAPWAALKYATDIRKSRWREAEHIMSKIILRRGSTGIGLVQQYNKEFGANITPVAP